MPSEDLMQQLSGSAAQRQEVLQRVREFRALDSSGFATLASHAIPEIHRQGEVLWRKGDEACDFLVVVSGNVMPRLTSVPRVQENQTVGLLPLWAAPEDGEEEEMIPRRTGDIVITSEEAVVLRIQYQTLAPWMRALGPDMARLFARHLADTDEALAYM